MNVRHLLVGDAIKATWVSSGATADGGITSALIDASQTVVASVSAQSSGNGFYYAQHQLPLTPGWYVNEWKATIGGLTYKRRALLKLIQEMVD